MTTLLEFLDGESLVYRSPQGADVECIYRTGVGVFLSSGDSDLGVVPDVDDVGARRIYWNLTGGRSVKEDEDQGQGQEN